MKKKLIKLLSLTTALCILFFFAFRVKRDSSRASDTGISTELGGTVPVRMGTNTSEFWPGSWAEDTNGLRVNLYVELGKTGNSFGYLGVGSVSWNSGYAYLSNPSGKFARWELRDSHGTLISPRKGKSIEGKCDARISTKSLPRWRGGDRINQLGFTSNSPPAMIQRFALDDIFDIPREDQYTLTVCPVIYKLEPNGQFADRIDLPCVSTKIHLVPTVPDN